MHYLCPCHAPCDLRRTIGRRTMGRYTNETMYNGRRTTNDDMKWAGQEEDSSRTQRFRGLRESHQGYELTLIESRVPRSLRDGREAAPALFFASRRHPASRPHEGTGEFMSCEKLATTAKEQCDCQWPHVGVSRPELSGGGKIVDDVAIFYRKFWCTMYEWLY